MRPHRPTLRIIACALSLFGASALAGQQPATWSTTLCVVQNGDLHPVQAQVYRTRGDTTVNGVPFAQAYPTTREYAAGESWYRDNEFVPLEGKPYAPLGLPRVVEPQYLVRFGEYEGVPLFRETGENGPVGVFYVPVRPGCVFQPYSVYGPDLVRDEADTAVSWPLPRPTAELRITDMVLPREGPLPTFQQVADRLEVALTRSGYPRPSYYAAPGGFAIVTPLEQFREGGASASASDRFPVGDFPVRLGTVQQIAARVDRIARDSAHGHYRMIVLLVTPYSPADGARSLTPAEQTWWKDHYGGDIPLPLQNRRLRPDDAVTVLVYEFERPTDGAPLKWRAAPRVSAETHLRESGVWNELDHRPRSIGGRDHR